MKVYMVYEGRYDAKLVHTAESREAAEKFIEQAAERNGHRAVHDIEEVEV